jgi:hypothetical protein
MESEIDYNGGESMRASLELIIEREDDIDLNDEFHSIPFAKIYVLFLSQKMVGQFQTSDSSQTITLFEKVLELVKKHQE